MLRDAEEVVRQLASRPQPELELVVEVGEADDAGDLGEVRREFVEKGAA